MSAPWTERQGQVGDLRHQSREELKELLLRQEKILNNKRLLQTLPDKGEKIREFAEKVHLAIEHLDEEERKQNLVSAARTELQSRYQQAFTRQQRATGVMIQKNEVSAVAPHAQEHNTLDKQQEPHISRTAAEDTMDMGAGGSLNSDETKEGDIVKALERVRVSETASTGSSSGTKDPLKSTSNDNYFLRKQIPDKPHYLTVLQKTETLSASMKQKFKPNQLLSRSDISPSGSSSPDPPSERLSPLSSQARKERDKKHLDDITAAKLPPLHHKPAQLLSLDQSVILLKDQTKKQQELQAKLAAQKLSEGLKISMGSYTPDGGPMAAYREVHDEGAQLSSDDD